MIGLRLNGLSCVLLCGALLFAGSSQAIAEDANNWVLGHWRAVDPTCTMVVEEKYSPDQYTSYGQDAMTGASAWSSPLHVSYNVSPEEVWMHVDGGGTWTVTRFVDATHIKEGWGGSCNDYVRADD